MKRELPLECEEWKNASADASAPSKNFTRPKIPFSDAVKEVLAVLDQKSISVTAHHELTQAIPELPRSHRMKLAKDHLAADIKDKFRVVLTKTGAEASASHNRQGQAMSLELGRAS